MHMVKMALTENLKSYQIYLRFLSFRGISASKEKCAFLKISYPRKKLSLHKAHHRWYKLDFPLYFISKLCK